MDSTPAVTAKDSAAADGSIASIAGVAGGLCHHALRIPTSAAIATFTSPSCPP